MLRTKIIERLADDALTDAEVLSSLIRLVECTEGVLGVEALARATEAWARKNLDAREVKIVSATGPRTERNGGMRAIEVWSEVQATLASVPTSSHGPWRALFRFSDDRPMTNELRELLLVVARVIGSALDVNRSVELAGREAPRGGTCESSNPARLLGNSPATRVVAELIPKLAASDVVVLLQGETGTGKSHIARLMHEDEVSPRRDEPFCAINCAAIPDALFESEIFGREKGAFTGAVSSEKGKLEAAGAGTLLLDEIGELSLGNQAKLLRAVEERRFERVGSNRSLQLKARIIVATHRDLREMVRTGRFREDLYYRVRNVVVVLPPLRERAGDISLIAAQILNDRLKRSNRQVRGFSEATLQVMDRYAWPGNIRELRAAIDRAITLGDSEWIEVNDLPPEIVEAAIPELNQESLASATGAGSELIRLPQKLAVLERLAIAHALRIARNNKARAAELLGLTTSALYYRLRQRPLEHSFETWNGEQPRSGGPRERIDGPGRSPEGPSERRSPTTRNPQATGWRGAPPNGGLDTGDLAPDSQQHMN